jgi:hypothetical protein
LIVYFFAWLQGSHNVKKKFWCLIDARVDEICLNYIDLEQLGLKGPNLIMKQIWGMKLMDKLKMVSTCITHARE